MHVGLETGGPDLLVCTCCLFVFKLRNNKAQRKQEHQTSFLPQQTCMINNKQFPFRGTYLAISFISVVIQFRAHFSLYSGLKPMSWLGSFMGSIICTREVEQKWNLLLVDKLDQLCTQCRWICYLNSVSGKQTGPLVVKWSRLTPSS